MKLKKRLAPIVIILILAIGGWIIISKSYKSAQDQLRQAQSLLSNNNLPEAEECFLPLIQSRWVKQPAWLGLTITRILLGKEPFSAPLPLPGEITIADFHLLPLLEKQLISGRYEQCIKLAEIGRYYGLESADIYSSASLLEIQKTSRSRQIYDSISQRLKQTVKGKRIEEALRLLYNGARTIVRDRSGQLLGSVDADGQFSFSQPHYTHLVQPVIINEIPKNGKQKGIRLSIDIGLSQTALDALGDHRGSIVLSIPGTGEILAAVSDAKTTTKMGKDSSPAFDQMREPASIMKLITTAAAFRHNLDPDEEISGHKCRGAKRYSGKILYCPSALEELQGLDEAMSVSCNTSFADLGIKIGWEKMLAELRLFGFDSLTANPYQLGKIVIPKGDDRSLADLSIGLENTVITPVHGAQIASVFGNGGHWLYPELIHGNDGYTGFSPRPVESLATVEKGLKILEPEWLDVIRDAMWGVTQYGGTAGFIAPAGFEVRMKTGTGGTWGQGFHINYIGYAGESRERIAFCVRITNKRTSPRARRAGYRTTRALLNGLRDFIDAKHF